MQTLVGLVRARNPSNLLNQIKKKVNSFELLIATASNLLAMAYNLLAMASNQIAMA